MAQKEHVLAEEKQMTAARTKQHEEKTYRKKDGKKRREESKAKSGKIVIKASIVTKVPVSATKPSR